MIISNKYIIRLLLYHKNGDVAVWGKKHGKNGHIAICDGDGTTRYFYSYDQNWIVKKMHRVKHTYKDGFEGVLRPINQKAINGGNMKYEIGQTVIIDVPIAFTGAKSGNNLLVDSNGYQFWINKSVVQNYSRIYGKGKILGFENGIYKVELAGSIFDCKDKYFKRVS